jgi:hypothetical protein
MNGSTLSQGEQILKAKYLAAQAARVEAGDKPAKKKSRKARRPQASNGTLKRNWRASQVIAAAMVETLNRVNNPQDGE